MEPTIDDCKMALEMLSMMPKGDEVGGREDSAATRPSYHPIRIIREWAPVVAWTVFGLSWVFGVFFALIHLTCCE